MFTRLALAITLGAATVAQAPGLRIFQSTGNHQSQMIDGQGNIVHTWPGVANLTAHVGPDGTLWRGVQTGTVLIGGATGRIQQLSFDGTLQWDYLVDGPTSLAHHDVEPMPNGNLLVIAWDNDTAIDAIALGRDPATVVLDWLPDSILELRPTGPTSAAVVWEWHIIDHVIQDFDPSKANFGVVDNHPELLDINYPPVAVNNGDWNHFNGLDYDPINDWIIVSSRSQNEIYLIDHSTTTAEAAGHTGGQRGKGGDILYRWGNPAAYGAGTSANQQLFGQHDPRFIPPGSPGAGHLTLFNNDYIIGSQSAVFEFALPLDTSGNIVLNSTTGRYGPPAPLWIYQQPGFWSRFASSAERLPNGNTLICSAQQNWLFEVTPAGQSVWSYSHPNSVMIFQSNYVERSLWADTDVLPVGGGELAFDHLVGSSHAGQFHLLLGSVSGTSPGSLLPGAVTLPLNSDFLTNAMATAFNTGVFVDTIGRFHATGRGTSSIIVPPGFIPPGLAGLHIDFAHVIFDNSMLAVRASNPVGVTIVP